jgi:ubiquinone/menaquinone biosynthesis C-methylase UbiE
VKSILDCSCGTGKHVARFSRAGFDAVGSDISNGMVETARRNAKGSGIRTVFVQADFKKLSSVFDRKFDCVVCWGNSLSHELEERGIRSALKSMSQVLTDKGVVLIQIRNLPKWVGSQRRIVPIHYHKEPNGDRKIFIYFLDFYTKRVRFNVLSVLEFSGKPQFEVNSVDYRIVSASRLKTMAAEAGLKRTKIYGDTTFSRFDDRNSEDIIVIGTK